MLTQTVICGFCEEPLMLDEDSHYCDNREFHELLQETSTHQPFQYLPSQYMEAEAFLTQYPEFKEHNMGVNAQLNLHRKVGAYSSFDQMDYETPVNYHADTELPVELNYDSELTREDEWESVHANRDAYQREVLGYWKDVEPARCTSVRHWWSNKTNAPGYPVRYTTTHVPHIKVRNQMILFTLDESYAQRYEGLDYEHDNLVRLEFNELQGFASEQLYDLGITERYGYRFFNIFTGKDNLLHVGLLKIDHNHGVTCSRGGCYYRNNPLPIPDTTDRDVQERFIHAIIRHGNNHGPDFYLKREDFAYIHAENCDTEHPREKSCNAFAPRTNFTTDSLEGALNFLVRHRKFCRDSNCRCGAYYHTLSHYERQTSAA